MAAEAGGGCGFPARLPPVSAQFYIRGRPDLSFPTTTTETFSLPVRDLAPGAVIAGRYRLIERLGEGGMGTVFLAEQTSPVQRSVAVKIIKLGMDTKEVVARERIGSNLHFVT